MTDIPEYRDSCPNFRCGSKGNLPKILRPLDNRKGVEAFYVCPNGHDWYTSFAWYEGVPHPIDDGLADAA